MNYYGILGVPATADEGTIRSAFRSSPGGIILMPARDHRAKGSAKSLTLMRP
jgi:hypothetical protein